MDTASAPHTHPESSRLEQSLPSTSSTPAPHATFQREGALPPVTQSQQPLATLLLPADRSHQQQQPPLHFQQTQHQGQSGLTGLPGTSQPAQTAPRSAQQQAVLNAQPIPVQHSIVQPVQQLQQQPQVSAAPRPTQSQQPAPIDAMPTAVQKERDNFGLVSRSWTGDLCAAQICKPHKRCSLLRQLAQAPPRIHSWWLHRSCPCPGSRS